MAALPAGTVGPAGEARALAARLGALDDGRMRVRAAARALAAIEPGRAVHVVAALLRALDVAARAATAAVARALADPDPELPYAWRAELYAAASDAGLPEVTSLLVAPPPARAYREPRDRSDPRLAHLTLGHKKALARARRDPDLVARLAAEGEPTVVEELLRNPWLTEELVARIAARRPCRPGTLRRLFESPRWRTRTAVARALVRNPYAEPEIALKLVPSLAAGDLADVARDGALHPLVRALAERLVASRSGG